MHKRFAAISFFFSLLAFSSVTFAADVFKTAQLTISLKQQFESVRPDSSSALAIHFQLQKDWHLYASEETAVGNANLKIKPSSSGDVTFSEPVFPAYHLYTDPVLKQQIEVFSDSFDVYLPFKIGDVPSGQASDIKITINFEGAMCSGQRCLLPKFEPLTAVIKVRPDAAMDKPAFTLPKVTKAPSAVTSGAANRWAGFPIWIPLLLAFVAGLTLNIMPCVLPVIPLIVLRIFSQAKQDKLRRITMGIALCLGIILFFAVLAGINIVLRLGYNQTFQWGGQFGNPAFLIAMSLLMLALSLFMFGVVTFAVPSSISAKSASGKGIIGSVSIGFLAAVLSTPCSFALLTAALAWAQTQNLFLATVGILFIGVGMAAPYAVLTSMTSLLNFVPKPGRWTEIFKQAVGFILLLIAVKLAVSLPKERIVSTLYFGTIMAIGLWMWGTWVTFSTPKLKKYIIRIIALAVVIISGFFLLPMPPESDIDWQNYDSAKINEAVQQHKPVLIKFTADWCLNCKAVEKFVYGDPKVSSLIKQKGILAFIGDATQDSFPAAVDLSTVYSELLPATILYLPGLDEPVKLRGIFFKGKLLEYLRELPDIPEQENITKADPNG